MNEHDETVEAFKNGAEYMRALILENLRDWKRTAMGRERGVLTEIIAMVRRLEVRV